MDTGKVYLSICIQASCSPIRQFTEKRLHNPRAGISGITGMQAANQHLLQVYLLAFNEAFKQPAMEAGSAFVPFIGGELDEYLCEQYERGVGKDVAFRGCACKSPKTGIGCTT